LVKPWLRVYENPKSLLRGADGSGNVRYGENSSVTLYEEGDLYGRSGGNAVHGLCEFAKGSNARYG
jgi:hypothetical protein